jgi:hypothetical protein
VTGGDYLLEISTSTSEGCKEGEVARLVDGDSMVVFLALRQGDGEARSEV